MVGVVSRLNLCFMINSSCILILFLRTQNIQQSNYLFCHLMLHSGYTTLWESSVFVPLKTHYPHGHWHNTLVHCSLIFRFFDIPATERYFIYIPIKNYSKLILSYSILHYRQQFYYYHSKLYSLPPCNNQFNLINKKTGFHLIW